VLDQLVERDPEVGERGARRGVQAEREQVGGELGADQELGRQVDHAAALALEVGPRRLDPAVQDAIAHREREREELVVAGRDLGELGELEVQLADQIAA